MDRVIPIEVVAADKNATWYLDVSNLSLSELLNLRKELHNKCDSGVRALDKFIKYDANIDYIYHNSISSIKRDVLRFKEISKNSKNYSRKLRRKRK